MASDNPAVVKIAQADKKYGEHAAAFIREFVMLDAASDTCSGDPMCFVDVLSCKTGAELAGSWKISTAQCQQACRLQALDDSCELVARRAHLATEGLVPPCGSIKAGRNGLLAGNRQIDPG